MTSYTIIIPIYFLISAWEYLFNNFLIRTDSKSTSRRKFMVTYTSLTSNKHKLYINTMNQLCTIINYIQNISFHNKSKLNQNPHTFPIVHQFAVIRALGIWWKEDWELINYKKRQVQCWRCSCSWSSSRGDVSKQYVQRT